MHRDGDRLLQLLIFNEECLVGASQQLAPITSLPFVHTARRSYRLSVPVNYSDRFVARSCPKWEVLWTLTLRGRRSRNKVSVGEPAEGSFTRPYSLLTINLWIPSKTWVCISLHWRDLHSRSVIVSKGIIAFFMLDILRCFQYWKPVQVSGGAQRRGSISGNSCLCWDTDFQEFLQCAFFFPTPLFQTTNLRNIWERVKDCIFLHLSRCAFRLLPKL